MLNVSNETSADNLLGLAIGNPCPSLRAISRPILFVHNYSLFFFGFLLNMLAFAVLMQGSLRCHSTFAYLAFLSLSNGLLSLVRFAQWMCTFYLQSQFENDLWTCRFYRFSLDFLTYFSLFTLVCVNIDRARIVTRNQPRTKYPKSTFRKVALTESLIALVLGAYHSHWLMKFGHQVNDGFVEITICNVVLNQTNPAYYYFITSINPLFELIIVFCLPLLINIICTSIIVRSLRVRMRRAKRFTPLQQIINESRRQQQQQTVSSGTRAFLLSICSWFAPQTVDRANIYSCFCFQIQCQRHRRFRFHITRKKHTFVKHQDDNESIDRQPADAPNQGLTANFQQITGTTSSILKRKHQIRRTRDKHLSAMLIVLNILYFLLNLPFNFHQTFGTALYQSPSDGCIERFTHVLLDILQQTYFSTNFFLYVLTNRRFREELHTTFRKLVTRDSSSLLETQQRQRQNSGNVNPSTVILAHQQHYEDYQTIPLHRDSCLSEIELSELPIIHSQQILVSSNERDQCISKLVLFERPH